MDTSLNEKRLTEAYDEFADAIFRHCFFRTGDREKGKEIMQDTFMKAWEYMNKGNDIQNMKALLYKMANNLVVDHFRANSKKKTESLETLQEVGFDAIAEEDTAQGVEQALNADIANDILQKVDEPYRTAVIMRYIDDLSPAEIAESLGESANSVSVRINRGLKMLRGNLGSYG